MSERVLAFVALASVVQLIVVIGILTVCFRLREAADRTSSNMLGVFVRLTNLEKGLRRQLGEDELTFDWRNRNDFTGEEP